MSVRLFDARGNQLPIASKALSSMQPNFFNLGPGDNYDINSDDVKNDPYALHAWTHACAWVIARNISQLPIRLVRRGTEEAMVDKWKILDLFSNPNPLMTYTPFMQHIVLSLLLADAQYIGGQCFIVPRGVNAENQGKVNLRKGEVPVVLLPLAGKYFSPEKAPANDGLETLTGWRFSINSIKKENDIIYKPEEIVRVYFVNPNNWLEGLATIQPAKLAILQDIKSDIYNSKLYDNNATPAGVLKTEMLLSQDQQRKILDAWYSEYGNVENAGKIAILQKGLEYQQIALTQQDMQYVEAKKMALEQMLASFGLNKIAVGLYEDINYATIVEGRRILWNDTYLPIAKNILEAINAQWVFPLNANAELRFDVSGVDALQIDYSKKTTAASDMVQKMGLPPIMAMRITGIPYTEQDVKDYPWLADRPQQPNAFGVPPTEAKPSKTATQASAAAVTKAVDRAAFSDDYIKRVLVPGEKEFTRKLDRFFISQRKRMQDNVDKWAKIEQRSAIAKATTFSGISLETILLHIGEEDKTLGRIFAPLVKDQLKRSEAKLAEELGGLVQWHVTDPMIDLYVANRKNEITSINTTTMQSVGAKVGKATEEAIKEGETVDQAARRIKAAISEVGEIRRNQAQMIARTEIGIVTSESRFECMHAEGIQYHEWITANDDKVRHTHVVAGDAGPMPIGTNFPGVEMPYPLYSFGDPGEIINCRCVAVAVDNEDSQGGN